MTQKSTVLTIVAILAIVAGLGGFYLWIKAQGFGPGTRYDTVDTPTSVLTRGNQDFATAQQYQSERDYANALIYYKKALPAAQDATQEGQIKYNIAAMTELSVGPVAAIPLLKEIAANSNYGAQVRANSIQEMGLMYNKFYGPVQDEIERETFKDAPYSVFYVKGDPNLTYRKLFEYATSFYPLASSEVRIALWYARDLEVNLKQATTTPAGMEAVRQIQKALELAYTNVEVMKNDPAQMPYVGNVLSTAGIVEGNLAVYGVSADFSKADAAFRQAIQMAQLTGQPAGNFHVFHYAAAIGYYYGLDGANSIKKVLTPFTQTTGATIDPRVIEFFRDARTDPTLTVERRQLISLGKVDPDFAAYLKSIGWNESDFTTTR